MLKHFVDKMSTISKDAQFFLTEEKKRVGDTQCVLFWLERLFKMTFFLCRKDKKYVQGTL